MSNSERTPGSWRVEERGFVIRITAPDAYGRGVVADLDSGVVFTGTRATLANARLIAAAPEMLAVLERIQARVVECSKAAPGNLSPEAFLGKAAAISIDSDILLEALRVLAKARGGT